MVGVMMVVIIQLEILALVAAVLVQWEQMLQPHKQVLVEMV